MKKIEPVNIIIMRGRRQVRTIGLSPVYLWGLGIFLVIFLIVSILAINGYLVSSAENKTLRREKVRLTRTISDFKLKSQLTSQYHLLIEELNQNNRAEKDELEAEGEARISSETALEANSRLKAPGQPSEAQAGAGDKPKLAVSNLILTPQKQAGAVNFSFALRKVNPDSIKIAGHYILVLEDSRTNPPRRAVYPKSVELDTDGSPAPRASGHEFAIQRGKTFRGRLEGLSSAGAFSTAVIYLYDSAGHLILKSEAKNSRTGRNG